MAWCFCPTGAHSSIVAVCNTTRSHGSLQSAVFNPANNTFTNVQNMAHGRWYPTLTTLGDGRIMTFSGLDENGSTNTAVEIYTVGSGWSQQYFAGWTPPLYPRMHLLPNGKVFYSGQGTSSAIFNPANTTWTTERRKHGLQRAALLRNLGTASSDAGQQLRPQSHDHGREQSGHRNHRNH